MKKIFRSTLAMAMLAIACYGGVKAFEKCVDSSAVSLIAANVEALSMPEGDGEFPRYKNVTKKSKYFETKFEYEDGEKRSYKFEADIYVKQEKERYVVTDGLQYLRATLDYMVEQK